MTLYNLHLQLLLSCCYVGGWKCLNGSFTIQENFDDSSADLKQYAMEHYGWTQSDGELNFAKVFSSQTWKEEPENDVRYFKHMVENGKFLLQVAVFTTSENTV